MFNFKITVITYRFIAVIKKCVQVVPIQKCVHKLFLLKDICKFETR